MRIEEKNVNWQEIGLSNDFFFGKVMRNPDLCKKMLERILPDLKIGRIEYPELQKTIKADIDARGIRLDVYQIRRKTPGFSYGDIRRVHRIYASN